jgi:hypothetical protein
VKGPHEEHGHAWVLADIRLKNVVAVRRSRKGHNLLWVTSTYRGYLVNLPRVRLLVHLASVQWSKLIYVTGVSDSRSKFL